MSILRIKLRILIPNLNEIGPIRARDIEIFQMAAIRQLEFSKFAILIT